jgi:hypothetical protein
VYTNLAYAMQGVEAFGDRNAYAVLTQQAHKGE